MLTGIKLRANPTPAQRQTLSQWMGCARFIWNAKCDEERYYRTFARKYYPIGTFAPVDQTAAHFKDAELSPWLSSCPSQILRNAAVNWYQTYQKFMKGICGRPKRHPKTDRASMYLTRELFRFDTCADGNMRLFIGSKTNNIGYLSFKAHGRFNLPNSLYIRKERGQYYVSFCYENGKPETVSHADNLAILSGCSREWLEENTVGVDRGVAVPVQAGDKGYDYSVEQKKQLTKATRYIMRLQRRLARQVKGSNRRNKTKHRIACYYAKQGNIRADFAHQTSRKLVNSARVIIFEALATQRMTKKAKPKQDANGKFIRNGAKAKSGLNKSILNVGWHRIEGFTKYKAKAEGKACFRIPAPYTSQECAECGHTNPDNRKTQAAFICVSCGHTDNADRNASRVIKKRAIELIINPGTGLTNDNELVTGRQLTGSKTRGGTTSARTRSTVKKDKGGVTLPLEALPL
ncbi:MULTISPECIES: RNA-guided endonuclease InsQ/TnpB family protein [Klebsiella]|uniref:RNA-guided endonuclease InsQ/TnpB family protein n=1 Tax=Klebsiella TaxID=570 RepID=UPI00081BCAD3|nr:MULTISPECIES: RNA-guided endonuclease TnpB family protein [Klebsiella]EFU6042205.1 transposase [Escherichia coli]MBK2436711.1 transposase [Klebsiella pneumoniae]MBK2746216.1 transposase [Klebsiella pneumoniae]MBM4789377.1 transposase [Klebsiella pneumoniae]MCX9901157.1 transposase [Klebsiella pneumoniae]